MAKTVPARGLRANDSTIKGAVGQLFVREGKSYRYYKIKDLTLASTQVVEYSTTAGAVTKDRAGGSSVGREVAGVAAGTITAGNYGWIQVAGTCSVLVPAKGVVSAGQRLIPHPTSDGGVSSTLTYTITTTKGTIHNVFAVALGGDTATTTGAGTVAVVLTRVA